MSTRNKSSETRQRWAEAERRAWEEFRAKLEAAKGIVDAQLLVLKAPPPDSPGRHFFSNLGFFLQSFSVPHGANRAEKLLYLNLVDRMENASELKPGVGPGVKDALKNAIAEQIQ